MTPARPATVAAVSFRGEGGGRGASATADVGLRLGEKGPPDVWVTVLKGEWPHGWPPREGQAVRYTAAVIEPEG